MKTELPETVQLSIIEILTNRPNVNRLILYGSRAKGTNRHNSDIDLCLDAPGMSLSDLTRLENHLDDLLLPWKIDLSLLHHIDNQELKNHIECVGKEWFKR